MGERSTGVATATAMGAPAASARFSAGEPNRFSTPAMMPSDTTALPTGRAPTSIFCANPSACAFTNAERPSIDPE